MLACLQTSSKVVFKMWLQNNKNNSLENELDFFSYNSENTKSASSKHVHISFVEFVLWLVTITIILIIACSLISIDSKQSIKANEHTNPTTIEDHYNNVKVNTPEMPRVKSVMNNGYNANKNLSAEEIKKR